MMHIIIQEKNGEKEVVIHAVRMLRNGKTVQTQIM